MVKNKLAIFTALAISVSSIAAYAQNDGGSMRGPGQGGGGQDRQQRFEARKAEILARLQQSESCVKAATDPESLRACMPNRGGRGGGGGPQDQQGGGGGEPQGQQGDGGAMGGGMGGGDAPPPSDGNAD